MPGILISPRRRAIAVAALGALVAMVACSVSNQEEHELGGELAASVDSQLPILHDSAITNYVDRVGKAMASRTSRADLDWHFAVVNTAQVNAFALPGGYVYVTRGAIEQSNRFDELAGVIGHEIGHVVLRHSVKQIQETEKRDVGLVLLCTLTRICSHVGGIIAVAVGNQALTAQYSQFDEAQADSAAVDITRSARIDPEGLAAFLQNLMAQRKERPTAVDAFFSTHPTDEARITALQRQIAALGSAGTESLTRDTPEFHAIQARVRALPPPPRDTVSAQDSTR